MKVLTEIFRDMEITITLKFLRFFADCYMIAETNIEETLFPITH